MFDLCIKCIFGNVNRESNITIVNMSVGKSSMERKKFV
jgi:hypothetical protein